MSPFDDPVVPALNVSHRGILQAPVQLAKERTLETVVRPVAYIYINLKISYHLYF